MKIKKPTLIQRRANVRRWVRALRSGKYKKGKGQLRIDCGSGGYLYCCLGVACEALGVPYFGTDKGLPYRAREMLGIKSPYGNYLASRKRKTHIRGVSTGIGSLTEDNDRRCKSFEQIADIIESRPKDLFEEGV